MSPGSTSRESMEFLLPAPITALWPGTVAEAGAEGDLNTYSGSDRASQEEIGRRVEEGDVRELVEIVVNSPTQPGAFSAGRPSYSKFGLLCRMGSPMLLVIMDFQDSLYWGPRCGDGILEDVTEAPDSDEAERIGGCSKGCAIDCGEPCGLYFTPCAMPS